MRKKIIGIFVCMLVIVSAMTTILYSNNVKVEASGGGGGGNGVGLDYDFMWNVTNHLSDIINTSYPGNVIRKGRMFGTPGDNDTARYINDTIMTNTLHLENVKKNSTWSNKKLGTLPLVLYQQS